jgi:membrane-associated protease RseP (regulator of RpoE activity)
MRRCLLIAFAAVVPLAGMAVLATRESRAQQPVAPPKGAAPKDVAPKDRDVAPAAPKDRDAAPRDTVPPTARQDSREPAPATRAPRDATRNPAPNANDANRRDATRETGPRERRSDRDLGITFGRVTDRGLAVNNLTASSALVRAGLRAGDFIVSVNGHRLERVEDFDRFAFQVGATDRIKVIVLRDGREEIVYLEPTVFYADESYDDDYTYFGVVLDDRYPDRLIVLRVYPDSPAFIAGLREGDEITTFHGQRLKTRADLGRVLHGIEPGNVDFEFSHDRQVVRAQAKFNERVAAREKTSAGANDGRPADNRSPQSDRQPGAAPNPQPAAPSAPNVAPNRPPEVRPGAAPGGQPPAPRNAPGGRQPAAPNQPSGPAPAAGPGGQQPQPPRNPPAGSPQADR